MEIKNKIKSLSNENNVKKISDERMNNKINLRKQNFSKKIIKNHFGIALFIDYENKSKFSEDDFINFLNEKNKEEIKEMILKMTIEQLKSLNYDSLELKYWLYYLRQLSIQGKISKIKKEMLDNLNEDKVKLIFQILIDTNDNNKDKLKFKYECCCILINLIIDSNKYNNIYIQFCESIYNFILNLSKKIENEKNNEIELILFHFIWLFSNIIENKKMFDEIHQNERIKTPFLIQHLFSLNNSTIYSPTLWTLSYFLNNISINLYIQYKIFINALSQILKFSIKNSNIELMNYVLSCLTFFFKSEEICDEVYNNNIEIIEIIINLYPSSKYSQKAFIKLIKNDIYLKLSNNYKVFQNIILPNLPQGDFNNLDKILLKNNIKLLKEFISLPNQNDAISQIISNKNFFNLLMNIFQSNNDIKVQCAFIKFLICLFKVGNNFVKKDLIERKIHILSINEIKKYINLNDKKYNCLIYNFLDLIIVIMQNYNQEEKVFFIKNELEDEDIYEILIELQESKDEEIYNRVCYLLHQYWEE